MEVNGIVSDVNAENSNVLHIPICEANLIPKVGLCFRTLEEGEKFYRVYADACGFSARMFSIKRAADTTVMLRYMVSTQEGKKNVVLDERAALQVWGKRKRRRSSCRIGCMARIVFHYKPHVGYVIGKFIEGHNHDMVNVGYRRLSKANVGAVKSFQIFKEMVGGSKDVGCRKIDFKNAARDMKAFADGVDAELLLEKFERLREKNKGFFFSYSVDESSKLSRLFWADSAAVQNYQIFGVAVSVDSTYSTNRYSLIFTPFTGRDNHGKCVNFGAGLISKEDANAYSWLLSNFVECMGTAPNMLITDQDLGLKAAVEKVLPDTRHRFCMWHIMMKLNEKLPAPVRENGEFFQKFDDMVWSDVEEPLAFEEKWHNIMVEFDLVGLKWFDNMFEQRKFWIPAYFRDVKMSGLFRTTSLSESENSFFKRFFNKNANLSELYMLFEVAIESQRDDHDALTMADETCFPDMKTKLQLECHAASVYTNTKFLEVQNEIELAVMFCNLLIPATYECDGQIKYDVDEDTVGIFKVNYNHSDDLISCSCNYFVRKGMVCRHMFAVMKLLKYKSIPDKYIERRWSKRACSLFRNSGQNRYASGDINSEDDQGLFALAYNCIGIADSSQEMMDELKSVFTDFYAKHANNASPSSLLKGKQKVIEQYYGAPIPVSVKVHPPKNAKTKGSCSRTK